MICSDRPDVWTGLVCREVDEAYCRLEILRTVQPC